MTRLGGRNETVRLPSESEDVAVRSSPDNVLSASPEDVMLEVDGKGIARLGENVVAFVAINGNLQGGVGA